MLSEMLGVVLPFKPEILCAATSHEMERTSQRFQQDYAQLQAGLLRDSSRAAQSFQKHSEELRGFMIAALQGVRSISKFEERRLSSQLGT